MNTNPRGFAIALMAAAGILLATLAAYGFSTDPEACAQGSTVEAQQEEC